MSMRNEDIDFESSDMVSGVLYLGQSYQYVKPSAILQKLQAGISTEQNKQEAVKDLKFKTGSSLMKNFKKKRAPTTAGRSHSLAKGLQTQ